MNTYPPEVQAMVNRLEDGSVLTGDWLAFNAAILARPDASARLVGVVNAIREAMGAPSALSEVEVRARLNATCSWAAGRPVVPALDDATWELFLPVVWALLVNVLGVPRERAEGKG